MAELDKVSRKILASKNRIWKTVLLYNQPMAYKVFLAEDEIVAREGIRDNVNWAAAGFEFCGEAPNGELALPLIEETQPDVIITDIKMPFMDGLQLSKIVRKHMPWVKIIILSGHDEFNFAQSAIKLGINEYLLKPISAAELHKVLLGLSKTLDQEKSERERLKELQESLQNNLALVQEKFILKLITGGISSTDAMEQSLQYGLDIIAKYYLVVLIKINAPNPAYVCDYGTCLEVEQMVSNIAKDDVDVFTTKKDLQELILLIKGNDREQLIQESEFRAALIKEKIEQQIPCNLSIHIGNCQDRLGSIYQSFTEALIKSKTQQSTETFTDTIPYQPQFIKLDHSAIQTYLKFGSIHDFESFFTKTIKLTAQAGLRTNIIKHYLFVDLILTVSQFLSDVGINIEDFPFDIHQIEKITNNITTIEQIQIETKKILFAAMDLRNSVSDHEHLIIEKAQDYLKTHFSNPDLKMAETAKTFNLSPTYFSALFKQEVGETYREYLSNLRIDQAKQYLMTTNLKSSEIAYLSGFNDPHYFSFVFKRKTGTTPQDFRNSSKE